MGPITVAVGTSYAPPSLSTTGFTYAIIWPSSITGGTGNINRSQYGRDGTLLGYDGSSAGDPPPGMGRQNFAAFYSPPINDAVAWTWNNTDSTNATVLGNILYTLT